MPELLVRRDDLACCRLVEGEARRDDLQDGEAQLVVERLALTTNTITYAVLGDQLGYWRLFPAPHGWARIPAWGYARVVTSRSPTLTEGRRYFGPVPIGRHVTVRPAPHPMGFVDTAPHRAGLSPLYNQYVVEEGGDDAALVMRPLFGTAVLLDLMLGEAGFHGARTVVMTSASSKTAYGLAHLLRARPVETIGLTSSAHHTWVLRLGLYDAVLTYDQLGELAAPDGAVLIDFAGAPALAGRVHERLAGVLTRSIHVGFTHASLPLAGPVRELFFAPDELARRRREFGPRYAEAWRDFAPVVHRTLRFQPVTDGDELLRAYRELLDGRAEPAAAYVVSPWSGTQSRVR